MSATVTTEMLAKVENPFALLVSRFQRDPVAFVRQVLGVEPDVWQAQTLTALQRGHRRISIRSGHGVGKAISVSEPVLTWSRGWQRAGDITLRDRLVAVDGTPTRIIGIHPQGARHLYRVSTSDGGSVVVDGDHLWLTQKPLERRNGSPGKLRTTKEIAATLSRFEVDSDRLNHRLPQLLPIAYPPATLPMDPWLLGAWLGDGNGWHASATHLPAEKAELFAAVGAVVTPLPDRGFRASFPPGCRSALTALGLLKHAAWDKFIPEAYLRASTAQRVALLQGLLDTDGQSKKGSPVFDTTSAALRDGVVDLVRGLGGVARVSGPWLGKFTYKNKQKIGRPRWTIYIALPSDITPFRHPVKLARWRPSLASSNRLRATYRYIRSVEWIGEGNAVCFVVAHPDRLFVVKDHIVTHNSTFLSWCLLWFALTRFPFKAVVTAPSAPQLFDALFAELKSWCGRLPAQWLELLEITGDRIALRARPDEGFISARTSRAESPESLAGVHSDHVMLVVDEASGVPERVFEAAGGSMSSPGAITLLTGNPTRSNGFFWRTQTVERDRWFTMRVSSRDSRRVDPAFCEEIAERYGIESNAYRVRVLGEFPLADSDTLIGAELVEQAMARTIDPDWAVPEVWGVDVARFGTDQSCLIKRRGKSVRDPPRRWGGLDLMQLTGQIVAEYHGCGTDARPAVVVVDSIGLGAGVADRLRELNIPVQDVNVAETPAAVARFVRLRDELWQEAADWLATRAVALPFDEQLRDDLCAPRYAFSSDGRLKVESKLEMRSRGIRSPDSADSLCLTFVGGAITAMASSYAKWHGPLRRNIRGIV